MAMLDSAFMLAASAHYGQRRKYTNEPYICHPIEVVQILIQHGVTTEEILCAAVLHDVLEDTAYTAEDLRDAGMSQAVVSVVVELTEPAHVGNRAERKYLECQRLSDASYEAQTIKYADLISNTRSIAKHDVGFAKVYLREKWHILSECNLGDVSLRQKAQDICRTAATEIDTIL